ncbi:MAG: hypothetical protein ACRDR6_19480 [Pseudonocardiaceae bacterium]
MNRPPNDAMAWANAPVRISIPPLPIPIPLPGTQPSSCPAPQALADIGTVPDHETLIEIPEDVLKFYARRYLEQQGEH